MSRELSNVFPQDIVELVQRFSGQTTYLTIEAAQKNKAIADEALRGSLHLLRWAKLAQVQVAASEWLLRLWVCLARLQANSAMEPFIFGSVAGAIAALLCGGLAALVRLPLGMVLVIALVPLVIILASVPPVLGPSMKYILEKLSDATDRRARATAEREQLRDSAAVAAGQSHQAATILAGVIKAHENPILRLLAADLHEMTGTQFEDHLAEIFRLNGYAVQQIGQSGDQGVDLIVSRGGPRTAVQAKCYGGSVGNSAVQQVFTGMALYRCDRCAVVTSSYFTNGARQAAAATGCHLITGEQLPDLIRGRIFV